MRVFVVLFAVIAVAAAGPIAFDFLNPVTKNRLKEYSPTESTKKAAKFTDDGYRYNTVRKLKFRHRRDVYELSASGHLPPAKLAQEVVVEEKAVPRVSTGGDSDGYRYKTIRHLKYRHRRNVNELSTDKHIPPVEVSKEAGREEKTFTENEAELAEDGYHYKTIRRLKYRHRRDVNKLPLSEHLPAAEIAQEVAKEERVVPEVKTELADNGYRYKTVRRLKYRHRRDVNKLLSNKYLLSTEITQKKLQKIDTNELPPNEYLPPIVKEPIGL